MESKYPIEIRRSLIQGYGVFAASDIEKGQLIEECPVIYFHHFCPDFYNYVFTCQTASGKKQSVIALGYGSLYNHSNKPNADWIFDIDKQTISFTAAKKINAGEEIYIYYAEYWFAARNLPLRELPYVISSRARKRLFSILLKLAGFILVIWFIKNAVIAGCHVYFPRG